MKVGIVVLCRGLALASTCVTARTVRPSEPSQTPWVYSGSILANKPLLGEECSYAMAGQRIETIGSSSQCCLIDHPTEAGGDSFLRDGKRDVSTFGAQGGLHSRITRLQDYVPGRDTNAEPQTDFLPDLPIRICVEQINPRRSPLECHSR